MDGLEVTKNTFKLCSADDTVFTNADQLHRDDLFQALKTTCDLKAKMQMDT